MKRWPNRAVVTSDKKCPRCGEDVDLLLAEVGGERHISLLFECPYCKRLWTEEGVTVDMYKESRDKRFV